MGAGSRARDDDVDGGGTFMTGVPEQAPQASPKSPRRLPPVSPNGAVVAGSPGSVKKGGQSPRSPSKSPRERRTPMETAIFLSSRRIAAKKDLFAKEASFAERAERDAYYQAEIAEAKATIVRLQDEMRWEQLHAARRLLNPPMKSAREKKLEARTRGDLPGGRPTSARQVTDTAAAEAEAMRETAMSCCRQAELKRLLEIAHRDHETALVRSQQMQALRQEHAEKLAAKQAQEESDLEHKRQLEESRLGAVMSNKEEKEAHERRVANMKKAREEKLANFVKDRMAAKEAKEQKDKEDKLKADAARELFFQQRAQAKAEEKARMKAEYNEELARRLEFVWREAENVVGRALIELEKHNLRLSMLKDTATHADRERITSEQQRAAGRVEHARKMASIAQRNFEKTSPKIDLAASETDGH